MTSPGSSGAASLRLMSDLRSMRQEPPEGCSASPISEDSLFVWGATIFRVCLLDGAAALTSGSAVSDADAQGPDESPWEGGVFSLRITFPDTYPAKPPRVRFESEIFHPNVFSDGNVCLDIIQDAWSPCNTVASLLTSIQSLLTDPNCASPANPAAAQAYQHDRPAYNKQVRRCAMRSVEG